MFILLPDSMNMCISLSWHSDKVVTYSSPSRLNLLMINFGRGVCKAQFSNDPEVHPRTHKYLGDGNVTEAWPLPDSKR